MWPFRTADRPEEDALSVRVYAARPRSSSTVLVRAVKAAWLLLLCATALISIYVSAKRALIGGTGFYSRDFQWSPTRLFVAGIDPYMAQLHGSPDILFSQAPNYLQPLYLILAPLGLVSYSVATTIWFVLNVMAGIAICLFFCIKFGSSWYSSIALTAAFLSSTPFRLGLSNGQQALLVLVAATVAFSSTRRPVSGIGLGLAIVKYSFIPVAFVVIAMRRYREVALGILVVMLSVGVFAVVVGKAPTSILLEPLVVARTAVGAGSADIMTVLRSAIGSQNSNSLLFACTALAASLILIGLHASALRAADWLYCLSFANLISLLTFVHLAHDFVAILPTMFVAQRLTGRRRIASFMLIGWFAFGVGALSQLGVPFDTPAVVYVSFALLSVLAWITATDPHCYTSELLEDQKEVDNSGA